jgi:uncharacterized protein YjiS (DUF1127 family)
MLLHDLRKRIAERLRIYRDINRLKGLDDHLLADVGIPRDSIADCVRGRC